MRSYVRLVAVGATAAGVLLAMCGVTGVAHAAAGSACSNPTVGATVPIPGVGDFGPSFSSWSPASGPSSCDVSSTNVTGASLTIGGSPAIQQEADGPHFVLNVKVQLIDTADGKVLGETSVNQDTPVTTWLTDTATDPGLPAAWPLGGLYSSASIPLSGAAVNATCVASGVGIQGSYSCALYSN